MKTPTPDASRKSKNRQRNVLWYNPPYSQNVETKIGKCFLKLIDQHFPKSNPLHKIFNRNTLKLSYSRMTNVKSISSNQNKAQISKSSKQSGEVEINCNCRNKDNCPLERNCNIRNIICQAEVTTPQKPYMFFQERVLQKCNRTQQAHMESKRTENRLSN